MLADNITLNTSDEYRLQVRNPTSSLRSLAGLPLGDNQTLRVSHETAKNGVISSALIRENTYVDVDGVLPDNGTDSLKVLVKAIYNPNIALSTGDKITVLTQMLTEIAEIIAVPASVDAFFNLEH